jgi:hypothetical protein
MLADDTYIVRSVPCLAPSLLPNEGEVESKFVVPLLQHVGYREECRHPQYSLKENV